MHRAPVRASWLPVTQPGGQTSIDVTYCRVKGFGGVLEVFDTFTLTRPRTDGRQ